VKALRSLSAHGGHLQDYIEILDVCMLPRTKFQILEETGMSLRHLHFCLKYLLKQSLVKYHYRKRTYVTTEAGFRLQQKLPHD
jgi:predicted transcriptional regulator